ncbi:MAG TPA: Calx-beta domain-containing protein [Pyrinomonadaceae bacterium]|nr:Calx-beta domain-containing protein [Pyrinomonadaceae bacterium]
MRHLLVTILLLSLLAAPARAQVGPQLTQSVVAGGGGVSAQGAVRVEGTVGQGVAGMSSGGSFTLGGGFGFTFPAANAQPVAHNQSVTTDENTPVNITLTGSDEETPAGSLVFNVTVQPSHGTLSGTAPSLTYTPANAYVGPDSFKFTVTDTGEGAAPPLTSTEATVSINVVRLPGLFARDARVAEPAAGQAQMLFTLTLDRAPNAPVSVAFNTSDGSATAGGDYNTAGGTVTFQPGQRMQTVAVAVLQDGLAEPDETFQLQLSNVSGGHLDDAGAVGTIASANTAGAVLVSELRAFGPGAANDALDEFVEIYNNTDAAVTVAASDTSAGWGLFQMGADCNASPVLVGTVPNGTVIPARGHFLLAGSNYSLNAYAAGDAALSADLLTNANLALFTTADAAALSSANRLDAVGFGANTSNNCALLREGTNLSPVADPSAVGQHSFLRNITTGKSQDTDDNAADFWLLTTSTPAAPARLGAPGPENLASPTLRTSQVATQMVAPCRSNAQAPNRERITVPYDDTLSNTGSYPLGTMVVRRTFTNLTGAAITRLRYRIVDLTAGPAPAGTSDLRAVSSPALVSVTNPCGVTSVNGTTLEQPPSGLLGGGLNSSLSSGTITVGTPLAHGSSVDVQFLFGVRQGGGFRFFVIIEALP